MIRGEIDFPNGEHLWLLVSQVEHAHISGQFTQRSKEKFSAEVVEAITHHDDGWADWESAPRLNPEIGGPYSFTEMPLAEALPIWDASIAAARKIGPLGGFIVAGHFYNLLAESEHGKEPAAIAWLAAKRKFRTAWLDEWVRLNSANTLAGAKEAQHQLFLADLFSLWLCCDCPIADQVTGDDAGMLEQTAMKERTKNLLGEFEVFRRGIRAAAHNTAKSAGSARLGRVALIRIRLISNRSRCGLMADVVPVAQYANWQELKAASRPMELRWRLIPPVPPSSEPAARLTE